MRIRHKRKIVLLMASVGLLCGGCLEATRVSSPPSTPASELILQPLELGGPANLLRISSNVYSGGTPHEDDDLQRLRTLGVRTIVSVDAAAPRVERARDYGLTYVHIPIGYDGISRAAGEQLAACVHRTAGPWYIHCHQGKHRGPAAAAIACVALGLVDGAAAQQVLETAGTSRAYGGLWRSVETYQPPASIEGLAELVASRDVEPLAEHMAHMEKWLSRLEGELRPNHVSPESHEQAVLLWESVRETARFLEQVESTEFATALRELERTAHQAVGVWPAADERGDPRRARQLLRHLRQQCTDCHEARR